jgi:hypothetical protein
MNRETESRLRAAKPVCSREIVSATFILISYALPCRGTSCGNGKAFLIIPRFSGAAGSPLAPISSDFPVKDGPGVPEQNLKGEKFQ